MKHVGFASTSNICQTSASSPLSERITNHLNFWGRIGMIDFIYHVALGPCYRVFGTIPVIQKLFVNSLDLFGWSKCSIHVMLKRVKRPTKLFEAVCPAPNGFSSLATVKHWLFCIHHRHPQISAFHRHHVNHSWFQQHRLRKLK